MNGNWWPWYKGYIPPISCFSKEKTICNTDDENGVYNFKCMDCAHQDLCEWKKFPGIEPARPHWICDKYPTVPCSAFEPASWHVKERKAWKGFWNWWSEYADQWLPNAPEKTLMYFTVNNDTLVRYGVFLMDYVNRQMIDTKEAQAKLKAVEKQYYKRVKDDPIGLKLVQEKISGVYLNDTML